MANEIDSIAGHCFIMFHPCEVPGIPMLRNEKILPLSNQAPLQEDQGIFNKSSHERSL